MKNWWKWLLGAIIVVVIVAAIALIGWYSGWFGNNTAITLHSPLLRPFTFPFRRGIIPFQAGPGARIAFGLLGLLIPCLFGLLLIALVVLLVNAFRPRPYYPPPAQPETRPPTPGMPPAQPNQPFQTVQPAPNEPVKTCPNCGRIVQSDWSHCPYCGVQLK
jgi:hypothetical protein